MPSPALPRTNYPDDPNTTLVKMRIFGEATAKHLGKLLGLPATESQLDLLRELGKINFVDDGIMGVFHTLRRTGNKAVHDYHNDLDDAAMSLRLGFRLGVWYYRLISKQYDFAAPIFVLPQGERHDYHQEVMALKQELEQRSLAQEQTATEIAAQQQQLVSLNGYIAILEGKQQETEAQTAARIAALEAQLATREAELATLSVAERTLYRKQVMELATTRSLDLSESESRYLIDAQLRKAGWEADTPNSNSPMALARKLAAIWQLPSGLRLKMKRVNGVLPITYCSRGLFLSASLKPRRATSMWQASFQRPTATANISIWRISRRS